MGRLIALTAKKINGNVLTTPRVIYVNEDLIKIDTRALSTGGSRVVEESPLGSRDTYEVYEKAIQIEVARNPATTDLYLKKLIASAIAGVGTTQGAGAVLNPLVYLNEALTIGAGATEAFVLPAATVGKVVVVLSNDAAGDAAKIFPASGESINAQADDAVLSVASGSRKHFVCLTAGVWTVADDYGS